MNDSVVLGAGAVLLSLEAQLELSVSASRVSATAVRGRRPVHGMVRERTVKRWISMEPPMARIVRPDGAVIRVTHVARRVKRVPINAEMLYPGPAVVNA